MILAPTATAATRPLRALQPGLRAVSGCRACASSSSISGPSAATTGARQWTVPAIPRRGDGARSISISAAPRGRPNEHETSRVIGMPPPPGAGSGSGSGAGAWSAASASSSPSSSSTPSSEGASSPSTSSSTPPPPPIGSDHDASDPSPSSSNSPASGPWSNPPVFDFTSPSGSSAADESGSSPEPSADGLAVAEVPMPTPTPLIATRRRVMHPFDSHAFVAALEKAGLSRESAKSMMTGSRELLVDRTDRVTGNMLSREELDNEAYLFKAALSKLRTEFNVRNRNTGQVARDTVSALRRELERVEHKMAADMQVLKHDVELELNNRKDENRNDKKTRDLLIEEINSRATISVMDLKTEIESAKWDATRRAIATIVLLVILGVGISSIGGTFEDPQKGATTAPPKPAAPPATPSHASDTRDVGVGTADDDLFEDEYAARIDKLLSTVQHHPVPAEPKPKPKRRQSKPPPPDLDRI